MMTSLFSPFERNSSRPAAGVPRITLNLQGLRVVPYALFFLLPLSLFGQESSATVRNNTEGVIVFGGFSQDEWERRGSMLWKSDPAGLFERAEQPLEFVPPGGVRVVPLSENSVLPGYLMEPDRSDWSLLRLSASPGEQITVTRSSLSRRRLPADQLPVPPGPVLLDGRFADWEREPSLSAIPSRYEPRRFIRERRGERRPLSIGEATGWGAGGTRLSEIKAVSAGEAVYLFFSWERSPIGETTLLLYLYGESSDRPVGTVGIGGDSQSGPLELWRPGGEEPLIVGNYVRQENAMEAEIRRFPGVSQLQLAVVSTLFRGEQWYEKFPITRIEMGELLN